MDVNQHERCSTFMQNKVKERRFYCCPTCHSHDRHSAKPHQSWVNVYYVNWL